MPRRSESARAPSKAPTAELRNTPSTLGEEVADCITVKDPVPGPSPTSSESGIPPKRIRKPSMKAAAAAETAAILIRDSDSDTEKKRPVRATRKRVHGSVESPAPLPTPKRSAPATGGQSSIYSEAAFLPVSPKRATGARPTVLAPPAGLTIPRGPLLAPPPLTSPTSAMSPHGAQLELATQKITDLEAQLFKAETLANTAKARAEQELLKLEGLVQENGRLSGLITEAESKLAKAEEQITSLRLSNNELALRATELEKLIPGKDQQAATLLEETKRKIRAERDRYYQEQLQEARKKINEAEKRIITLTEEKKAAEAKSAVPTTDHLVQMLDKADTKAYQLQDQMDVLKSRHARESKQHAERITILEQQLADERKDRQPEGVTALEHELVKEREERATVARDFEKQLVREREERAKITRDFERQLINEREAHQSLQHELARERQERARAINDLEQQVTRDRQQRDVLVREHNQEINEMIDGFDQYLGSVNRCVRNLRGLQEKIWPTPPSLPGQSQGEIPQAGPSTRAQQGGPANNPVRTAEDTPAAAQSGPAEQDESVAQALATAARMALTEMSRDPSGPSAGS